VLHEVGTSIFSLSGV